MALGLVWSGLAARLAHLAHLAHLWVVLGWPGVLLALTGV